MLEHLADKENVAQSRPGAEKVAVRLCQELFLCKQGVGLCMVAVPSRTTP